MVAHIIIKRHRYGFGLIVAFLILAAITGGLAAMRQRSSSTSLTIGNRQYTVKVVSSAEDRAKGLSGTAQLPADRGMLFVFGEDKRWGIWMKDMNYPIDILWLDTSKTVVDMASDVSPSTYPSESFQPRGPARYVLELAAGSIADASISIGDQAKFDLNDFEGEQL